jgi:hypothetical protein
VVAVNGELTLNVQVENAKGISEGHLSIGFDPNLLAFKSGSGGDLLRGRSKPAPFAVSSKPGSGIVDIQIGRGDPEGINGSGLLFTLILKGERHGSSRVDLTGLHLVGPENLPLEVSASSGVVTVK